MAVLRIPAVPAPAVPLRYLFEACAGKYRACFMSGRRVLSTKRHSSLPTASTCIAKFSAGQRNVLMASSLCHGVRIPVRRRFPRAIALSTQAVSPPGRLRKARLSMSPLWGISFVLTWNVVCLTPAGVCLEMCRVRQFLGLSSDPRLGDSVAATSILVWSSAGRFPIWVRSSGSCVGALHLARPRSMGPVLG